MFKDKLGCTFVVKIKVLKKSIRLVSYMLLMVFSLQNIATAQNLSISVVDEMTQKPISTAVIIYEKQDFFTNDRGVVELNVSYRNPIYLEVSKPGYENFEVTINDAEGMRSYRIALKKKESSNNVIILDEGQLQEDETAGAISSILRASRDPFLSAAAFNFGAARFRVRGYDNEYSTTMVNNLPMMTLHNSRVPFNFWGGLNDVFRNNTTNLGMDQADFTFGNLNGASNTDISAGSQRKQTRVSYAAANRTYRNRLMATHSSGEQANGWSYTFSGSRRWADEGYVQGTFYDAWSYFASVEKRINDVHSLSVSVFGAPIQRGSGTGSLNEMYDLAGNNYYNPNWGILNGEKKSARFWTTHEPMISAEHTMAVSDKFDFKQSVGVITGRSGQSRLDWYNAPDPRPDYYRYLPSFYSEETEAYNEVKELLSTSEENRQLNWSRIFETNLSNFETIEDVNRNGETVSGLRSLYALKEDRQDLTRYMYNGIARYQLTDETTLHGGLTAQYEVTHFFQSLRNLLGGDYWYDVNQFVEREFPNDADKGQADLNNPNRVVREGDDYGYNYKSKITDISLWTSYNAIFPKVDFHFGAQINYNSFRREGLYKNGAFPDSSFGNADAQVFISPSVKGGINYKINGRNYIYANATYQLRAPDFRNSYVSPRFRNQVLKDIKQEQSYSGELAYVMRSPFLNIKALGYLTRFRNLVEVRSAFIDGSSSAFVNIISQGEGRTHVGTEISAKYKLTTTLSASFAAGIGQNYIDVRPTVDIIQDNTGIQLVEDETIYVKNFRVPGPQSAYTLGLSYNSPKYWYITVNANYFDHMYMDYNPLRRTVDAVDGLDRTSEFYFDVLRQERLDPGFTLDLFGGGSKKIGKKFVYFNVGVNNILNNTTMATGGFEQLRLGTADNSNTIEDLGRFPSRYFYAWGLNYFVNLSFRF